MSGKKHSAGFEWTVIVFALVVIAWVGSKLAKWALGGGE